MNEIITNEVPEVIETAIETAGRFGLKHVVGGFVAGLCTGIAGTRLAKSVGCKLKERKAQKNEKQYITVEGKSNDDDADVVSEQ